MPPSVDHLREEAHMDVLWVRDDPTLRREQDDGLYYQKAKELNRYLLTHDEDFWNDVNYPMQRSPGCHSASKERRVHG